jgi:hypothetical protein
MIPFLVNFQLHGNWPHQAHSTWIAGQDEAPQPVFAPAKVQKAPGIGYFINADTHSLPLINYPKKISIKINSGLSSRFPAIVAAFACLGHPSLSLAGQYDKSQLPKAIISTKLLLQLLSIKYQEHQGT